MSRIEQLRRQDGFTLAEVSILLTVVVLLSAAITPVLSGFIDDTRLRVVRGEMATIAQALQAFLEDIGCTFVPQNNGSSGSSLRRADVVQAPHMEPPSAPPAAGGSGQLRATLRAGLPCSVTSVCSGDPVELLVSSGDVAALGPEGDSAWVRQVDLEAVDFLEYFLVSNTPGNDSDNAFPTLADCGSPVGILAGVRAWQGAYMNVGGGDPWGNRYVINTELLVSTSGEDVVVLSAGPDQEIDSSFAMDGFVAGDDDIALLISVGQ